MITIVDVKQVIHALERSREALIRQRDVLGAQGDYSAEMPGEDAERMTEAIALLQLLPVTEAPHDWEVAYDEFKKGPRFDANVPALKVAFAAGMEWQIARDRAVKAFAERVDMPTLNEDYVKALRDQDPAKQRKWLMGDWTIDGDEPDRIF